MRAVATIITSLGDAALLLPAAAVLLLFLAKTRAWRTAAAWTATLALCTVLTVIGKMIFHACGSQYPALDIRSPSGHTSLSVTFYLSVALMLSARQSWSRRFGAILGATVLAMAIAASRVVLHSHSLEDVAAGFITGLVCVGFFASNFSPRGTALFGWRLPLALVVALALLTHGHHLSIEHLLDRLSDRLQMAQRLCPVSKSVASRATSVVAPPKPELPLNPAAAPASNGPQLTVGTRRTDMPF